MEGGMREQRNKRRCVRISLRNVGNAGNEGAAWAEFHEGQAERLRRTLEPLVAFHEARAEECRDQPNASEATKGKS